MCAANQSLENLLSCISDIFSQQGRSQFINCVSRCIHKWSFN